MATRRPPLDPRLISQVRAARVHLVTTVSLGLLEALCAITTAWAVARLGAALLIERELPQQHPTLLALIAAALSIRALALWWTQRTAHRAATATIAHLRAAVIDSHAAAGPRARSHEAGSVTTLATAGLENLRPYLTGYVPQLALAATVTPLCLVAIFLWDPLSAAVALIAVPLIPIFMILIGLMTQGASQRSLATMRSLWGETLDLIEGLPTLKALGRAQGSERIVASLGSRHKRSSMTALAFAFLSSFALELIATLGVALIAVSIGLRLVDGSMELQPAIAVLVLAAEVYLPLRLVGQQFHASTDGMAALDAAFDIIDDSAETPRNNGPDARTAPDLRTSTIEFHGLSVHARDAMAPHELSARISPGRITVLRGPSGGGKSTAIAALLALIEPSEGSVEIHPAHGPSINVLDVDPESLWTQVTWLPQRPVVGPGTIREVLTQALPPSLQAEPRHAHERLEQAAALTGLDTEVIAIHGWDAPLGRSGQGLSVGQRQRVALSAALLDPRPLIIADEPTSHLDATSEAMIIDVLQALRDSGSTIVMTAHREALIHVADTVIDVHRAPHSHADHHDTHEGAQRS